MLRHCAMFTWNDDADDAAKSAISEALDDLATLDMVNAYTHGPDAGISDGNWDYIVVADFESRDDYQAYASDPGHLQVIAELIRPNISGRAAIQFEY